MEQQSSYFNTLSKEDALALRRRLDYLQEQYNNTEIEEIEDESFDAAQKYYIQTTGSSYNPIGAKSREEDIPLARVMPSLDKIKGDDADELLTKHYNTYGDNTVYELKLDGISLELSYKDSKLLIQKRGDGEKGCDISHIQQYIKFPMLPFEIYIRAELVMYNTVFEELKPYIKSKGKKAENSRSSVNGATSKVNIDTTILTRCTAIAYEIIDWPGHPPLTPEYQLKQLQEWGFNVVPYVVAGRMNKAQLDSYLEQCREQAACRIDGIVCKANIAVPYEHVNENPKHAFAFKKDTVSVTKVKEVGWNITSKDGYLNPVVYLEPVIILGSEVSYFTGHNARFILEKRLGPGALVAVTLGGDCIPAYVDTIIPAPVIYTPQAECEWNSNGVELRLKYPDQFPQIKCMKIKYFLDRLGVKEWGLTTIWKLFCTAGVTDLSRLIRVTKQQLMIADKIEDKSADNLLAELHKGIANAKMNQIMAGSGFFGEGLSDTLMGNFIKEFPDWKFVSPTYDQIRSRDGFGPVRATAIANGIDNFKIWLSQHPEFEQNTRVEIQKKISDKMAGCVITFTGFTDDIVQQQVESMGGIVKDTYVKAVNIVVAENLNSSSKKVIEAKNSGGRITLMQRQQFNSWVQQLRLSS